LVAVDREAREGEVMPKVNEPEPVKIVDVGAARGGDVMGWALLIGTCSLVGWAIMGLSLVGALSCVVFMGRTYSMAHVEMLRDWASECEWEDAEEVEDVAPEVVLVGCQRALEGGLQSFDWTPLAPPVDEQHATLVAMGMHPRATSAYVSLYDMGADLCYAVRANLPRAYGPSI
jgi:hypothetical protein